MRQAVMKNKLLKVVPPCWPLFQKAAQLPDKHPDSYLKHPCFRAGDVTQLV